MEALLEYATDKMLTSLLVKERAKCRRRNRSEKKHLLDKDCDIETLPTRKMLSRIMPPRYTWVIPRKREKLANGASDTSKNAEKAILLTIKRDRKLQKKGKTFGYLDELDVFMDKIRTRLVSESLSFESPMLLPIFKSTKKMDDGRLEVTCRPLSVYTLLEDKIILALTSRYLSRYFNKYIHENILSYRPARNFHGKNHHVTDFNDGVDLIKEFRETHNKQTIYAADCDIKKFYDIISHDVIHKCFDRILAQSCLKDEGVKQVKNVLDAYLNSYNFYTHALEWARAHDEVFYKVRRRLHDKDKKNVYKLGWVEELMDEPIDKRRERGVPQGGSLSLIIANIVLNDVDEVMNKEKDENRLFIRYCDDMILLHTDYDECCRLMKEYSYSLTAHKLLYHDFEHVSDSKSIESGKKNNTTNHFWQIKSHYPFLWGDGEGNCNRYIGFLGYEMRRDGRLRLRKSNIKRYEEKFNRMFFALYRGRKKHTIEKYHEHIHKKLNSALDGVNFYSALDLPHFKQGSQFHHLNKMREKTERHLMEKYTRDVSNTLYATIF